MTVVNIAHALDQGGKQLRGDSLPAAGGIGGDKLEHAGRARVVQQRMAVVEVARVARQAQFARQALHPPPKSDALHPAVDPDQRTFHGSTLTVSRAVENGDGATPKPG